MNVKVLTSTCGVTTHDLTGAANGHGVGRTLLLHAIKDGELPARKRAGKYLLRCVDVEAWIDATTEPSVVEIGRIA